MRGSPATSRRASGTASTEAIASGRPLYGRITPGARTVLPSSARRGSLRKTGWGITRSVSGATPKPTSASRPRSEWTTIRSNRRKRRLQRRVRRAVRRGSRSCAVKTSGLAERSSATSSSGAASHWRWKTSACRRRSRRIPPGCSSAFSATRACLSAPPARARVERLVEDVPGCGGPRAEAKRRRHQLDLEPRARERSRELVVVGRRVGRGIGEDDAHGSYSRGALGSARPQLERLPRANRSARAPRLPQGDGGARDRRPTRRPLPPGGARLGAPPARGLERRDDGGARDHAAPRLAGAARSLAHALARGVLPLGSRGAGERDPRATPSTPSRISGARGSASPAAR